MARVAAIAKPVTANPGTAARLSFATAAAFVILLAALHVARPELDPSWRFISEYAIGDYGWIMALAFLLLAVSHVLLFIAVRPPMSPFAAVSLFVEESDQLRLPRCGDPSGRGRPVASQGRPQLRRGLRHRRRERNCSEADLWRFARICRVANVILPYLEATA